jgi:hypothetical protein
VLNGRDHLAELGYLFAETAGALGLPDPGIRSMTIEAGRQLLAKAFDSVERHDFLAQLVLPSPEPVARYVASMRTTQAMPDPAAFTAAAVARIPFGPDGTFRVTTQSGLLICR